MARYTDSSCKLCRREGVKLFLKGERCFKPSCSLEKRQKRPGQHGDMRQRKFSDYAKQLREKQKVKRAAGMLEKQFRRFFGKASKLPGLTGENMLILLERRLDNVVRQLGFAPSIKSARQMVNHGIILVDNKKVDIPSYLVKTGQEVSIKEKGKKNDFIKECMEKKKDRGVPAWLEMDITSFSGKVVRLPRRDEISIETREQLFVEYYSR